jgi:hypothetical protein
MRASTSPIPAPTDDSAENPRSASDGRVVSVRGGDA